MSPPALDGEALARHAIVSHIQVLDEDDRLYQSIHGPSLPNLGTPPAHTQREAAATALSVATR